LTCGFREIINDFTKTLRTNKWVTREHRDYILIKELYHCTPTELDKQPERILNMHFEMLMEERKHEYIEAKRNEQRMNQKRTRPN